MRCLLNVLSVRYIEFFSFSSSKELIYLDNLVKYSPITHSDILSSVCCVRKLTADSVFIVSFCSEIKSRTTFFLVTENIAVHLDVVFDMVT